MSANDSSALLGDAFSRDPLAALEGCIVVTPQTQSVDPLALGLFHEHCSKLLDPSAISIDQQAVELEAQTQPLAANLVLAEFLLALGDFPLAVSLAEKLYARHPMDHRVQDTLIRAKYYKKNGRVSSAPGLEMRGNICPGPWEAFHALPSGSVHQCCSVWLRTPVGNLFRDSVEGIWNSEGAQAVRRSAINGDYRYCGKMSCPQIQRKLFDEDSDSAGRPAFWLKNAPADTDLPRRFNLSYDKTCNLSCPSCRTERIAASGAELHQIEAATDRLIDALKQADRAEVTGAGDPFASKSFRRLLMALNRDDFPKLKLTIMTNGLLLRRSEWPKFAHLHGMIDCINVSVDATRAETYRVVRRGGEIEDLLPNLEFIGELRRDGAIRSYRLCFVAQGLNFREMPEFVELADKVGADTVHFQMLHDWDTYDPAHLSQQRIQLQAHPCHEEFLRVLRSLKSPGRLQILSDFSYLTGG